MIVWVVVDVSCCAPGGWFSLWLKVGVRIGRVLAVIVALRLLV